MNLLRHFIKFASTILLLPVAGLCSHNVEGADTKNAQNINFNLNSKEVYSELISKQEIETAKAIFLKTWDELRKECPFGDMRFKSKIVFINGAPGAGKGTNTRHIIRVLEVNAKPIEVSSLLTSPEAEAAKAKGNLVDDAMVIKLVFECMLAGKGEGSAVIIDGFPRTKIQAYALRMLIEALQGMERNKHCVFMLITLAVDHDTSIDRQLTRGRSALEHNKKVADTKEGEMWHVRETDISREGAEHRWNTYVRETELAISLLRDKLDYYEINTKGTFDEVRDRIHFMFNKAQ